MNVITYAAEALAQSWHIFLESSVYIIFGLLAGGLLRAFLDPDAVSRHLGQGRFKSVFKAALLGIPIPLCSCGVLPAAAAMKKQGANNGATTAFLISTPESGVDSIAMTYALMDPVMTVARPVAAFAAAAAAGVAENLFTRPAPASGLSSPEASAGRQEPVLPLLPASRAKTSPSFGRKIKSGLFYAVNEIWNDMVLWFLAGLLLAGIITALTPDEFMARFLGGGMSSMLVMLVVGIPLYICATASTPVAAALILKGVSPGAALVFLLAGPATNLTSLTVILKLLGRRATAIYLVAVAVVSVLAGLAVDQVYAGLGLSARAVAGQAAELVPAWAELAGAAILIILSIRPLWRRLKALPSSLGAAFKGDGGHASKTCSTGAG